MKRAIAIALWLTTVAASAGAQATVDEIVVYARKRAELIEDTPVSVTAFDADRLQATGVTRIEQIQTMVPNTTMLRGSNGLTASFNIRGVGNFPSIHFDQGVGVYVDGVYLSRNTGTILDLVDVQSIEVLRGPQGTLFGKNTLGGAVNVTTVKPKNEFEASLFVRAGSYDQVDTKAILNVPLDFEIDALQDKLFGRFTFASFYNEGYTYNSVRDERASDRNSINFLGSLRYLPTDWLTVDISGTWSKNTSRGLGAKCVYIEPENIDDGFAAIIGSIGQIVRSTGAPVSDYRDRCNATTPYRFEADDAMFINLESYGAWGVFNIDLGAPRGFDSLTAKYTSSWREQSSRSRGDIDQTGFPIVGVANSGGGPFVTTVSGPLAGTTADLGGSPLSQRQIQQELQVNASALDERLTMIGGLWGFWENAENGLGTNYLPGTIIGSAPVGLGQTIGDVQTSNWDFAVYTQITAQPTEWLGLTGGVRYTLEKKGLQRVLQQPLADTAAGFDPLPVDFEADDTFSDTTPMANLTLTTPQAWIADTPIEHLMGYFTYSQGFRGGGFNGDARFTTDALNIPFKPETIESFEWGIKSVLWENKVSLSLAYFRDERTDQQIPQVFEVEGQPIGDVLVTNAGQSSTQGFEGEIIATPISGMLINGSVGYLDGVYDEFPDARDSRTGEVVDRSGERFSFLPEWQTYLGVQYSFDVDDWGPEWAWGSLTPRADWSWQSRVVNWNPELPELVQPAFHLLNLRTTYQFNDGDSSIAVFVNNVTDEAYFRDSIALGPRLSLVVGRYYEAPRWWGVEISQRF